MGTVSNQNLSIFVVGKQGVGKSTITKNLLKSVKGRKKIVVYDVNSEHKEFFNEPFLSMEEFLLKHQDDKNTMFVFEEATIFFTSRSTSPILREMLVRKRHANNDFILLFHGFRFVPNEIISLASHCIICKTNDNEKNIRDKFTDEIVETWKTIQDSENQYINETLKL